MEFWQNLDAGVRWSLMLGGLFLIGLLALRQCTATPTTPTQHRRGIVTGG
jgi:hypothetical protein